MTRRPEEAGSSADHAAERRREFLEQRYPGGVPPGHELEEEEEGAASDEGASDDEDLAEGQDQPAGEDAGGSGERTEDPGESGD